jgi:EmrB/QacA subfamily drug resistance transporter
MTTADAQPVETDKIDRDVLKIASVVVIGAIMAILDITVVSVGLPTFQHVFHTNYANVAWTMTGYTLALATVIPLTGWAADRFGTKRLYMLAITLFVAGSALCSTAGSIGLLITFRVLQGLGGGMLMPLGMTIMTHAAGPERVGRVMAILGVPMLLGPIGGPILGGWLIQSASWRWIFLINVPIGAVAFIASLVLLPADRPSPSETFDVVGLLLLSPGLALTLFGVSSIPTTHTVVAARVLIPAAVGIVLVAAFIRHALRKPRHPLIDLHLFRNRQMTIAVITMTLFAVAFFGAALLFPSYFLQVRGEKTLSTGLLMIPQGLGAMVTMPLAGQLTDRIGPGKIVLTGISLIVPGMIVFTQVTSGTPYWVLLLALFVMGLGMGATMMPTFTAALQTLTHASVARGSTLMNILQQVASSIGTATFSVVLTNLELGRHPLAESIQAQQHPGSAPPLTAAQTHTALQQLGDSFGTTFILGAVLTAACLIPAFLLPRRKVTAPVAPEVALAG